MGHKVIRVLLFTLVSVLAIAGVASAHAVVYPRTANANSYEKFSVRVPNEKDNPTVKVRVEFPAEFAISRVQPLPGWSYEMEKSADGKSVTAVTWSGGKILPTEFQEFVFQGKTPQNPGNYAFKVYQTYSDGETVAWAGPSDAKTPASLVAIVAAPATTDEHGAPAGAAPASTPAATGTAQAPSSQPAQSAPSGTSPWSSAAGYAGLLLGLVALIVALRRK